MHQFPPPAKPPTFEAAVATNRTAVESLFNGGAPAVKPKAKAGGGSNGKRGRKATGRAAGRKPITFPATWSNFKDALSGAQYRKCAFCEGYAVGQGFGDVEHYAPKSEVQALSDDESTWGVEVPNLANVVGRKTQRVSATGYWWLAYDWNNYVLACTICNQQWKRAIFPIKEARGAAPARGDVETPYLLHPFRGEAPKDHLQYGPHGEVSAKKTPAGLSPYGRETIRTLGLDRPGLRDQRGALAGKIHKKTDALNEASAQRRRDLLEDIHLEGADNQPFCGMVRAIFEQRTGISWTQLETELTPPAAPAPGR